MSHPLKLVLCAVGLSLTLPTSALWAQTAAVSPFVDLTSADFDEGQQVFQVQCARCHGMFGEGGEGPSLTRAKLSYAANDAQLMSIIRNGISGTGMPGSWQLSEPHLLRVAGYVSALGVLAEETMPGDPEAGLLVYQTKGNCASCHILAGKGKGVGPELTSVGQRRNAHYLRQSVINPDIDQPKVYSRRTGTLNAFLTVRVVSEYGTYEGLRINEDEFSVQVRDMAGQIYSFEKSKLSSYEKAFGHSLMPGYGAALSSQEVDDVVSYLMTLKGEV
jgi:putative heme-binding domain-containing protein